MGAGVTLLKQSKPTSNSKRSEVLPIRAQNGREHRQHRKSESTMTDSCAEWSRMLVSQRRLACSASINRNVCSGERIDAGNALLEQRAPTTESKRSDVLPIRVQNGDGNRQNRKSESMGLRFAC